MVSIKMSESKEEAVCNNTHNHRQMLLHHHQELERDLEAGSCAEGDDDDEEDQLTLNEGGGGEEDDEVFEGGEGEDGEPPKKAVPIPPLYRNIEEGCTALGCYSAIATTIVMIIGIVALLMYSSPANATAKKLVFSNDTGLALNGTEEEEMETLEMKIVE